MGWGGWGGTVVCEAGREHWAENLVPWLLPLTNLVALAKSLACPEPQVPPVPSTPTAAGEL